MEKRILRIEIILGIVIVLLIGNIIFPFFSNANSDSNKSRTPSDVMKLLPKEGDTREYTDNKFLEIKNGFNNSNWQDLYNVLGDDVKEEFEISLEDVVSNFKGIIEVTGKIIENSYSHHEYRGNLDGCEYFDVYYKCEFSNGDGFVLMYIRGQDDKNKITGFNVNLNE